MKSKPPTPHQSLRDKLINFCFQAGHETPEAEALADIPRKWQKYGNFVLLTSGFRLPFWNQFDKNVDFWSSIASALKVTRVALLGRIESDGLRTPKIALKYGQEQGPIVRHVEQGIVYTWDVTRCMFSQGNMTEKTRIGQLSCSGETVVDLFAGIGYFTLPYLVRAGAAHVIACEWNPTAVACLRNNLIENQVSEERYTILEGDNRVTCPRGIAHRVNLGLIPSSQDSWVTACQALMPTTNCWLHIHGNVTDNIKSEFLTISKDELSSRLLNATCSKQLCKISWSDWARDVCRDISKILNGVNDCVRWEISVKHIEHVKSYAPHVDHMVVDLLCEPGTL